MINHDYVNTLVDSLKNDTVVIQIDYTSNRKYTLYSEVFVNTLYLQSDDSVILYCTPCYTENNSIQFEVYNEEDNTHFFKNVDFPLTYDIEVDKKNYISIVSEFLNTFDVNELEYE
jgi:hypothetical protein